MDEPESLPRPNDCPECSHPFHGDEDCEVELGDGYIGGVYQALGPCGCPGIDTSRARRRRLRKMLERMDIEERREPQGG